MAWTAGKLDFRVTRGSAWLETLRYLHSDRTPIVFAEDDVVEMQVRTMATRDGTATEGLVLRATSDAANLQPGDVLITLDRDAGEIAWRASEGQTIDMNPENVRTVRYAYSLHVVGEQFGGRRPLLTGTIEMLPDVIRPITVVVPEE